MNTLKSNVAPLLIGLLLLSSGPALADENAEYTCDEAAEKVSSIIEDWYLFIRDAGAEAKNPSVLAMHADHEKGVLVEKFKRQCVESWAEHEDIYTCFAGTRTEIGAAMCKHPDTNKNGWRYQ